MSLLSGLKSLFGGSGNGGEQKARSGASQKHEHKGFEIETQPGKVDGGFRVGGVIRKDGKEHQFIRADLAYSEADAHELTLFKAKQTIDQMGDRLFG